MAYVITFVMDSVGSALNPVVIDRETLTIKRVSAQNRTPRHNRPVKPANVGKYDVQCKENQTYGREYEKMHPQDTPSLRYGLIGAGIVHDAFPSLEGSFMICVSGKRFKPLFLATKYGPE